MIGRGVAFLVCLWLPSVAFAQEAPAPETPVPLGIEIPDVPGIEVESIIDQAMRLAEQCAQDIDCITAGARPNPIETTFDRVCRAATEWSQLADTATTALAIGWQMAEEHHGVSDGTTFEEANPTLAPIVRNGLLFAAAKWGAVQLIKLSTNALRTQGHRAAANLAECGAAGVLSYVAVQNHRILSGLGGS